MTAIALPPAVERPEIGSLVVTIPDTVDQLLERIDDHNAEWFLVLIESKWFKKRELVRLPFRAPLPSPGSKVVREVTWTVDRAAHIVHAYAEGPLPSADRRELYGDLETFVIPRDQYTVILTLQGPR